jgi:iron complex transport system permease protein
MALGRNTAVGLGLRDDVLVMDALALARPLAGSDRHLPLLVMARLFAVVMLFAGQMVFKRLLRLQSALPAVLEFAGGVAFLWLLLKGRIR